MRIPIVAVGCFCNVLRMVERQEVAHRPTRDDDDAGRVLRLVRRRRNGGFDEDEVLFMLVLYLIRPEPGQKKCRFVSLKDLRKPG